MRYHFHITENGIELLREEASSLENSQRMIHDSTIELLSFIEMQADTLGPHLRQIQSALTSVLDASEKSDEAVLDMGSILRNTADRMEKIIYSDRFSKVNLPET